MKKIFKLLLCAAIVAAGFTACSEDVTPIDQNGTDPVNVDPLGVGQPTNATFSFKLMGSGASTKALNPDTQEGTTNTVTEFRVLIFRADNTLEVDTARSIVSGDSLLTIPLQSGTKKVYVYANGGTTDAYLTTPAKAAPIAAIGDINGRYSFVTGTLSPGVYFTDLTNMHSLYPVSSGQKFFFSSVVKEATQGLLPGISAADSKIPGGDNYINVFLERAVAKVSITKSATSDPNGVTGSTKILTRDSAGIITDVNYKIWSANVAMYPFQNYDEFGRLVTPEYIPTSATDTTALFNNYARALGNGSGNAYIAIADRSAANQNDPPLSGSGKYYYIPENNPSVKMKGNTTIAEVQATFTPTKNHYVRYNATAYPSHFGVNYNESQYTFTVYPEVTSDLTTTLGAGGDLYLFVRTGTLGLLENTLFAGTNAFELARRITYHIDNPTVAPITNINAAAYTAVTEADVLKYFIKYTAGKAYYRLNLGEQTGTNQNDYTIKRNWYYDANITGFAKLGDNSPTKLIEPINEILEGPTNLSVHIIIRDWTGKKIESDV
jgi:hypothetical protein